MINCIKAEKCSTESLQLKDIINSALENKSLSNKRKALLYDIYAEYSYTIDSDVMQAVSMAKNAIDYNPSEIKHYIKLINFLVVSDKYEEARKLIETVKQKDTAGRFSKEIDELSKVITIRDQETKHR